MQAAGNLCGNPGAGTRHHRTAEAGTDQHRAAGNKTVAELLDAWREWRPAGARSPSAPCSATAA
jgi:hypothetical protein